MTHDLFSTLYRLRHCLHVPVTEADLPDPAKRPAIIAVRDALGAGEALPAEHHFQALLALPPAELERSITDDCVRLMHELECWHGKKTLAILHDWAQQCPMSVWPRVLEIMYWNARLAELRFYQGARPLPSDPWHDLSIVMHLIYVQALSILGQSPLDWKIAQQMLAIELITDQPEWVDDWCDGDASVTLPERELLLSYASSNAVEMGLEEAWWPELPSQPPAVLQNSDKGDLQALGLQLSSRWLAVGVKTSPYGFSCLQQTAVSHVLWLPVVPSSLQKTLGALAQKMSLANDDANAINSLFWQEDIHALIRQDYQQKEIVTQVKDALRHQPLSNFVRINLLNALLDWWESRDPSSWNIGARAWAQWQCYRCAMKLLNQPAEDFTEQRMVRLVRLWAAYGKQAIWCRPIIEARRHNSALAAVLYGAMCDNGWAGLKQDAEKAEAWYRYAVELAPPGGVNAFGATDCMSEPFSRALLLLSDADGKDVELEHLLAFAADAGYSDAQYRRGLFMSIAPERFDSDEAEQWLLASIREDHIDTFVAHYHLGILYAGRISDVDVEQLSSTSETSLASRAMYHFIAFLQMFLDNAEASWRDEDYQQIERAMFHAVDYLCKHPELQPMYLQPLHHLLITFRDEVRLTAGFTMLAYLYGREDSPMPHFDMAVRMIEGVRQLFPQIESVQVIHGMLRRQSQRSEIRFDQIAATATADDLPGCSTITPPEPSNPFQ